MSKKVSLNWDLNPRSPFWLYYQGALKAKLLEHLHDKQYVFGSNPSLGKLFSIVLHIQTSVSYYIKCIIFIVLSEFQVKEGYRLAKPEHCRRELYNIMYYCWDKDAKQRPTFTECVELLEKLLMAETDYTELERFPDHSYYNMMSLSGEKL